MKKLVASAGQRRNGNVAVLVPENGNRAVPKPPVRANGEVYLSAKTVELYQFDEAYLRRLQQGHQATQEHFVSYFRPLLRIKLRGKPLHGDAMKDVEQETFLRVLLAVRSNQIHEADRLGAFVNSTCNNILKEWYRQFVKDQHADLDTVDPEDSEADLEGMMISDETKKEVHRAMNRLQDRDRKVLCAVLEGGDKNAVCKDLGVDRDYLRVLTHRAIGNFKEEYQARKGSHHGGRAAGTSL